MIKRKDIKKQLNNPIKNFENASKEVVKKMFGEETAAMVNFEQKNPHHCYDLWHHTLHTVEGINKREKKIKTSPELLKIASFFHDVGKPEVSFQKEGRLVFYGHASRSSEIAEKILKMSGEYTKNEISLISFFIRHHDDFISYVLPTEEYDKKNPFLKEINKENVFNHIEKNIIKCQYPEKDVWHDLILLCISDVNAQSEKVFMNGVQTDSKEHKNKKNKKILKIIKKYKKQ